MAKTIKRAAAPASGYRYQTWIGLQLLLGWLEYPDRYRWVKFEADDEPGAQGLDDIIYERPDGLKGLVQVKFTTDADDPRNGLDWAWLTHRATDRSKSLLQKWSSAAFSIGLDSVSDLCLITNRRPDAAFEGALRGPKVALELLAGAQRAIVIDQVGDEALAQQFFERFEFRHSEAGYKNLERAVSEGFENGHTDRRGFLELEHQAIGWSIYKDSPAPDGRITLGVLRDVISRRRPRSLDQAFRIPDGYLPPDEDFAEAFIASLVDGSSTKRVLWGSPGQGKSTFVSYVCGRLREQGVLFARHHYFLNLTDASDRFSFRNVGHSLIEQIRARLHRDDWPGDDEPENLRAWVDAISQAQAREGTRYFIFVDGLDHVWRENDKDLEPLDALLQHLLPLPENTTMILGTQRVDESQLARSLRLHVDETHWIELPRMRAKAVKQWLSAQLEVAGAAPAGDQGHSVSLGDLALALQKASAGHPLVLTYTFLALKKSGKELTAATVEDIAPVPVEDVSAYYRSLWIGLSWGAKDALHLMASDELIWPRGGLEACLQSRELRIEAEIGHLLSNVEAGLVAFHGSLYVFIAQREEHRTRIQALAEKVEAWLADEAPEYLRWAWLWIYQGRRGDASALIAGTTRSWAVDALAVAYPVHQMIRILEAAEEAAFVNGDYGAAVHRRSLKQHLTFGLDHQLDESGKLDDAALKLTPDPYPALLMASDIDESGVGGLHQLAMFHLSLGRTAHAAEIQERMEGKIADQLALGAVKADDYDWLVARYLDVAAGTGSFEPANVVALLDASGGDAEAFKWFLRDSSKGEDPAPVLAFASVPLEEAMATVFELEALRTAGWCGAAAHAWDEFQDFGQHSYSICWALLYGNDKVAQKQVPRLALPASMARDYSDHGDSDVAPYLHARFFGELATVLKAKGQAPEPSETQTTGRPWLNAAVQDLIAAARRCGGEMARGGTSSFASVYEAMTTRRPRPNDSKSWADEYEIQRAVATISADLFLLQRRRSGLTHIPAAEWRKSKKSPLFAEYPFRSAYLTRHYLLLDQPVVKGEIEAQASSLHENVVRFGEKATGLSELCLWAHASGLDDLALELLRGAYRTAISYGSRKDWRLPGILDSVVEVSRHDPDTGRWAIRALAPIYIHLDEMTEKTGGSPSDLAAPILDLTPDALPSFYEELLRRGQWYEAEQVFATFAKRVDLAKRDARTALAFLWESPTWHAIEQRACEAPDLVDRLLAPWERSQIKLAEDDGRDYRRLDNEKSLPTMPDVSLFGPTDFQSLMDRIEATGQGSLIRDRWLMAWFEHWMAQGKWRELLQSTTPPEEGSFQFVRAAGILDRAYEISLDRQGPTKAFEWLIHAQRHSRGWSETYHASKSVAARLALVAERHANRWEEFVQRSTPPAPGSYDTKRVIPDVALVSLMLRAGEVERAAGLLRSIVALMQEEFETQPMHSFEWLEVVP